VKRIVSIVLAVDRVTTALATALACLALVIAVGAGAWQVFSRFATATPAVWSEALVRTALIWMVMLGLATALRTGALVSIDLAYRLSSRQVREALAFLALAANLTLTLTLFWFGWTMAQRVQFQILAGMEVSMSWAYAAIPVGCAFAVIGAIAHALDRRDTELESAV